MYVLILIFGFMIGTDHTLRVECAKPQSQVQCPPAIDSGVPLRRLDDDR
jgi:hypothetical protein